MLPVQKLPEWQEKAATSKPLPAEVDASDEKERLESPPRLPSWAALHNLVQRDPKPEGMGAGSVTQRWTWVNGSLYLESSQAFA